MTISQDKVVKPIDQAFNLVSKDDIPCVQANISRYEEGTSNLTLQIYNAEAFFNDVDGMFQDIEELLADFKTNIKADYALWLEAHPKPIPETQVDSDSASLAKEAKSTKSKK